METLTPLGAALRREVLAEADRRVAIDTTNVSTALVSRVLLSRMLLTTASEGLSRVTDAPPPQTWEAVLNLIVNMPAEVWVMNMDDAG